MQIESEICRQKSELRQQMKSLRLQIPEIQKKDYEDKIFKIITSLEIYKTSNLILTYVSTSTEIDTFQIIEDALSSGKKVAIPHCSQKSSKMDFFYINSISGLITGYMGILEPDHLAEKVLDFSKSICIVPAYCFDLHGNRLGYGKGYYDRFLKYYNGTSIGLCISSNLFDELPHNEFDVPVDIIVMQDKIIHHAPNMI